MPEPSKLIPLKPNWFHIMLTLLDQPHHGYAIMQEVERRTEGKIRLWPATLYGTIRRLEKANLISAAGQQTEADSDDERRQYYDLTDFGRRVLVAEVDRLDALVKFARAKEGFVR